MSSNSDYIAYLETETVRLAAERDRIKAALICLVMKLNMNRDTTKIEQHIQQLCRDKSNEVYKQVIAMYNE